MKRRRGGRGFWVVLCAAYLLVLQSILANAIANDFSSASAIDSIAKIICGSKGIEEHTPDRSAPPDRSHLPGCCTYGCPMFGPSGALPCPDIMVAIFLPAQAPLDLTAPRAEPLTETQRTPQSPRAPPLQA